MLRVVLANPLTTDEILSSVLDEQCEIVLQPEIHALLEQVEAVCAGGDTGFRAGASSC